MISSFCSKVKRKPPGLMPRPFRPATRLHPLPFWLSNDDRLHKCELKFALQRIHPVQQHPNLISDREFPPRTLSDDLAHVLVIRVPVARKRLNGNQALNEQIREFHKGAVARGADDHPVELLA